jgi:hypothetical protein
MEEAITILADFKLSEINLIKNTLHEDAIVKLMNWKVRQMKRQYQDVDEDGKPKQTKKSVNTNNDLLLVTQLFGGKIDV